MSENRPYFNIRINGQDIDNTKYAIESFSHEDCIKEDDMLSFSIKGDRSLLNFPIKEGDEILAKFGYSDGQSSSTRICFVKNFDIRVLETEIQIKALDKGSYLKKRMAKKVWKNLTASQIASQIADYYGMTKDIEVTSKKYTDISQGKRTDFAFLADLAKRESDFYFKIAGNTLTFKKLDLSKKATLVYEPEDGFLLDMDISYKSSEGDGSDGSLKSSSLSDGNISSQTPQNSTATGSNRVNFNVNGSEIKASDKDKKTAASNYHTSPHDASTKKNIISNKKRDAELNKVEATAVIIGNPTIKAGDIVTINKIGTAWSGNWLITKVVNSINIGGSYQTTLTLNKNATQKSVSKTSVKAGSDKNVIASQTTASNNTSGKPPRVFDANGNPKN